MKLPRQHRSVIEPFDTVGDFKVGPPGLLLQHIQPLALFWYHAATIHAVRMDTTEKNLEASIRATLLHDLFGSGPQNVSALAAPWQNGPLEERCGRFLY